MPLSTGMSCFPSLQLPVYQSIGVHAMRFLCIPALLAITAFGIAAQTPAQRTAPARNVDDNVLVSDAVPKLRIKVDPAIRYIGRHDFRIRDVAAGERFVFADVADKGKIRRMIIVQFEGYLPHVADGQYRFSITNPVRLGAHEYRHNTYFYDEEKERHENPNTEPEYTARFLQSKGLHMGPERMMSRFARPVGDDKRNEIIIFYFEDMADHGLKLSQFNEDAPPTPLRQKLGQELSDRSLKVFQVED